MFEEATVVVALEDDGQRIKEELIVQEDRVKQLEHVRTSYFLGHT